MTQEPDTPMSAEEVAAIIKSAYDSPDILKVYFNLRDACDPALWREVISILAQTRG